MTSCVLETYLAIGVRKMAAANPSRGKWLTSFVPHRLEMLKSHAWQSMPGPLAKLIERLEIEHLSHGGQENGHLFVPFSQFEMYGISRRRIRALLDLGEGLGLIEVRRDPSASTWDVRPPNAYRLTYLVEKGKKAPTDEWRLVTAELADAHLSRFRAVDRKIRASRALEAEEMVA